MYHHCRRYQILAAAVAVAASVAIGGCSSSHNSGSLTTTTTAKSFSVDTPEGTVSVSLDGQLPPHWPSDFPIPPDTTPAGSGSVGSDTTAHMIAVFSSSGTGQEAFDFYKNSTALTITNPKSVGTGSSFAGRLQFSGTHTGSVSVTELQGQTLIIVYLKTSTTNPAPVSGDR